VVGNKKALTAFQDRFNEHVKQRGYDLERGQSRQVTNAKHEQISQYKQKTEYHKDRKSTRLNSSHVSISYAVFCLKKKKKLIIKEASRLSKDVDLNEEETRDRVIKHRTITDQDT